MLKNNTLIFAENVLFPKGEVRNGPFYVTVKRGKIEKITTAVDDECERCDAVKCHLLAPGFVDIHNHGLGGGEDVIDFWQNPDYTCGKAITQGTTSLLATVVFPEDTDKLHTLLEELDKKVGRKDLGAVIEGIHAEGPFISEFGGLPKRTKEMEPKEFSDLLEKMPSLKIMTVSPSVTSKLNYQPIKMLHERDILPALGHDRQANEAEIIQALSMSTTQRCHVTHLFNVSKFHHRNPGIVNFGLLDEYPFRIEYENILPPTIEMIGDLVHVHPLAIKLALSSRSWENIAFVTDNISEKNNKDLITYCGRKIKVDNEDNVVKSCDDNTLVGSCTTMFEIFKNLTDDFDVPVGKALMMLSENPARIAKLNNVGTVEVGKDANLIMFDSNYNILKTFVDGRMAFRTSSCRRKRIVSTESFDESFES